MRFRLLRTLAAAPSFWATSGSMCPSAAICAPRYSIDFSTWMSSPAGLPHFLSSQLALICSNFHQFNERPYSLPTSARHSIYFCMCCALTPINKVSSAHISSLQHSSVKCLPQTSNIVFSASCSKTVMTLTRKGERGHPWEMPKCSGCFADTCP